jgi:uroporphyrinogen-III synthase
MSGVPIVVLRPEPGNGVTTARLVALDVPAISSPFFVVEPLPWQPPAHRGFDALLLTSANAARLAGSGLAALAGLPVWCVGDATAAAARSVGLAVAQVGNADAAALIADSADRLLWLCGEDRTVLPPSAEARVTAVPVYRVSECEIDKAIFSRPCIALLHSTRAARRLAVLLPNRAPVTVVAISPAVAATAGDGWADVAIASRPDDAEMVAIAAKLCQKQR